MQRKKLLYYQKSKAAKESELNNGYDLNSRSYIREIESDYDRLIPKRIKHKSKRKHDFSYYEEPQEERRAGRHNRNRYFESDYIFDVGENEFNDYVREDSYFSIDRDVPSEELDYNERKRGAHENMVYDTKYKHKRHKNSRKSPFNYNKQGTIGDKKDFDIYISQNPINYRFGQDNIKEHLEPTSHRKQKLKKYKDVKILDSKPPEDYQVYVTGLNNTTEETLRQQKIGDTIPTDFTLSNFTSPRNPKQPTPTQSLLKLIYLPVYVINNQSEPQETEGMQLAQPVNSTSKLPNGSDSVADSQNWVPVYTAQNTDQNKVFKGMKSSKNGDEKNLVGLPVKSSKENSKKVIKVDPITVRELKKKLCESPLGAAMSPEEYAVLIASHPEQKPHPVTLPAIVKAYKKLKYKKPAFSQTKLDQSDDKHKNPKKCYSKIENSNSNVDMKVEYKAKQDDKQSFGGKSSKIDKIYQPIEKEDLEEMTDGENIIINIRETPLKKAKTSVIRSREKEMDSTKKVTQGPSLISKPYVFHDKIVQNPTNLTEREITSVEYNFDKGQVQKNNSENPSFVSKDNSKVSHGSTKTGNYKNLSNNQSVTKSQGFADGCRSSMMSKINDVKVKISQTQEERKLLSSSKQGKSMINATHEKESGILKRISFNEPETFPKDKFESQEKEQVFSPKGILKKDNSTAPFCVGKEKNVDQIGQEPPQEKVNEENLIDNAKKETPLEIILPPPEKHSRILGFSSITLFHNERRKNLINYDSRSKLFEYAGTILIMFFQTAQFILGVTCYDKLINVTEVFYRDDY